MASSSSRFEQASTDLSSLYEAIKSWDIDSLKQLLALTAPNKDEDDVDNHLLRRTDINNNSLHVSVQLSKSVALVKKILNECGSSKSLEILMQQNINGNTPLHIAARAGSTEIVSRFIDHAGNSHVIGEDEDYDDIDVEKGIMPAEKNATCKSSVEQLVRIANKSKNTALHEALLCQADSRISKILRSADPGFEYFTNDSGETPLYLAVKFGPPDLVDYMLKICPSQSYGAPGGRTALHALALRDSDSFEGIN
ncbi:hypothetical protein MKX03_033251 [Papaver bracteatum]|nr:hypothetical protein MKX03_033251 [Papaver bracteatum]